MAVICNSLCTGCGACAVLCPSNCIEMRLNSLGRLMPVIDTTKCIHCHLCEKMCPQNNSINKNYPFKCYVAWSKEQKDLIMSASGGVGAVIARTHINNGGVVCGCDYDSSCRLQHFSGEKAKDIERFRSSKYSQSSAYPIFTKIQDFLNTDKKVVFLGTPCQCAALKRCIKKNMNNLLLVDIVCHGTPPNQYLIEHIKKLKLFGKVDCIRFRGEFDKKLTLWKDNTIIYQKNWDEDLYFRSFYDNVISYDACLNCNYACAERCSDITIGDFWGLGELKTIKKVSDRPSLILVNTEKGSHFFEKIKSNLLFEEREILEGISGNGRLICPPGDNRQAKIFKILYPFLKFEKSAFLATIVYPQITSYVHIVSGKLRKIYNQVFIVRHDSNTEDR